MSATEQHVSHSPTFIKPSASEIKRQELESRNLETAVRSLHQDGLVVVEDVIPHKHLDHLNETMTRHARVLQSRGENSPYNFNRSNLQQDAPPWAEYFHTFVFTNPMSIQIASAVLGPRPRWTFCSGNTAMPPHPTTPPQRQPVHSDADFVHPDHPFALVINVPLIIMTPHNGSTELWLGTHTFPTTAQVGEQSEHFFGCIREDCVNERRRVRPPVQPTVKKGSLVIRDLRLWHAGMPNRSEEVRVMLAMVHFAGWYRNRMRLEFCKDVEPVLREKVSGLEVPVDYVEREEAERRYLERGSGGVVDFSQHP